MASHVHFGANVIFLVVSLSSRYKTWKSQGPLHMLSGTPQVRSSKKAGFVQDRPGCRSEPTQTQQKPDCCVRLAGNVLSIVERLRTTIELIAESLQGIDDHLSTNSQASHSKVAIGTIKLVHQL